MYCDEMGFFGMQWLMNGQRYRSNCYPIQAGGNLS